ncbi:general secretion pathway protein J [Thiogranum longum]|uniref:Type II secretion system protein J n=1 Tax=Thiogranum longum TaxID=1537524 RepID=A0A4R1HBN8_9GAMM|nr:type II secretion system minor pseudopilin GspJ [Thiogranum longum]TCK19404.1 general secretion pathway protein J [Thiogranum longum]
MRGMRGFTLLELLVALSIFAAIGVMAYSGLANVMRQQSQTEAYADRMQDLQLAYRVLKRDFEQIIDRSIRNEFGDVMPALVTGGDYAGVEFTHAGYPNPAGYLRSNLQRVAYLVDDDRLVRRSWRVLDRSQDSQPDEQQLAEGVRAFSVRYLDLQDNWQERWPPASQAAPPAGASASTQWPRAVEVQLTLDDLGVLKWLFRLPDTYQPAPPGAAAPGGGQPQQGKAPGNT